MGNVSSLSQWDTLFQALTTPEDLRAYLDRHAQPDGDLHKTAHLLVGTLHVDTSLLRLSEVAESFDTATFCLGQLVSHEPKIMSELPIAKTVVSGLSCALSKGWHVHHGVAKFAANSLTILCLCEEAVGEVRDLATTELLNGLAQWLQSEGEPEELDEVCGCNCGCAALSATCWVERLLSRPDARLERRVCEHPALFSISADLLRVVSRRDGNPFALSRLLGLGAFLPLLLQPPHASSLGREAWSYLAFGLRQFDNQSFVEDGVQALLALLKHRGGLQALLEHPASLHLLEDLAAAACFLPSAATALERIAQSAAGRTCLQSLGAKLAAGSDASNATAVTGAKRASPLPLRVAPSTSRDSGPPATPATPAAFPAAASSSTAAASPTASSPPPAAAASSAAASSSIATSSASATISPSGGAAGGSGDGSGRGGTSGRGSAGIASAAGRSEAPMPPATRWSAQAAGRLLRGMVPFLARGSSLRGASALEAAAGGDAVAREGGRLVGEGEGRDGSQGPSESQARASGCYDLAESESSGSEWEEEEEGVAAESGAEAWGGVGLPEPDNGSAGSVERWDEFCAELHTTPTAARLAGLAETGLWEGLVALDDMVAPPAASAAPASPPTSPRAEPIADEGPEREREDEAQEAGASAVVAWPNAALSRDVVRAWVLLEIAGFAPRQEEALLEQMSLAHKRIWLARRLYREHHGHRMADEEPILFVECTRLLEDGAVLRELRDQCARGVGLGSDDLGQGTLEVHFKGENSAGSAVRREWFSLVSDAFVQAEGLLVATPDQNLRPAAMAPVGPAEAEEANVAEAEEANVAEAETVEAEAAAAEAGPSSEGDEAAGGEGAEEGEARSRAAVLDDYVMLGRFLGLALLEQVTVGVRLHESVCRLLLSAGKPWEYTLADVERLDPLLLRHKVRYLLDNEVEPLGLDFTDALHDEAAGAPLRGAARQVVELKPGGGALPVTEENKAEYVDLVCRWRLFGAVGAPVEALLRGLHAAVPAPILRELSALVQPSDLALMLAGEPHIDLADWRRHCITAGGLSRRSRRFRWFWRVVRSYSQQERQQLLQFVTGSRQPPVGGFAQLQGFNGGVHKFTLCAASHEPKDSLPRVHACICTLDLPEYSSCGAMRRALHIALSMGAVGFDDAAVAGDDEAPSGDESAGTPPPD